MFGLIIDRPIATAAYIVAVLLATIVLAHVVSRRLAASGLLIDAPNHRSNHVRPTPRTGGVAVFLAWLAACYALSFLSRASPWPAAFGAFASVAIPAFLLGLADDWRSMPAGRRLIYQIAVATMFCLTFGALVTAPAPFVGEVALGPVAGPVLTVFWIVAFMNAYNFMDGANGLAGLAGLAGASAIALAAAFGGDGSTALIGIALAAALLGFLPVNFPSGRIFLGDAGSMSIGFTLAALAVMAARRDGAGVSPLFAPIVFMPLLFDVAMTLASRAARGRRLSEAHSEHAYQLLIRSGASHVRASTLYFCLTLMSAACAVAATRLSADGQWAVVCVVALALAPPHLLLHVHGARAGLLDLPAAKLRIRRSRRNRRRRGVTLPTEAVAGGGPAGFRQGDLEAHEEAARRMEDVAQAAE